MIYSISAAFSIFKEGEGRTAQTFGSVNEITSNGIWTLIIDDDILARWKRAPVIRQEKVQVGPLNCNITVLYCELVVLGARTQHKNLKNGEVMQGKAVVRLVFDEVYSFLSSFLCSLEEYRYLKKRIRMKPNLSF